MSHCENCARGDTRPTFQEYVDYLTRVLEMHPEIADFRAGSGVGRVTVYSASQGIALDLYDPRIHYGDTPVEFFIPMKTGPKATR